MIRYRNRIHFTSGTRINFALLIFSTSLTMLGAEFALRFAGYQPWHIPESNITAEPGGRFFAKHPSLGYTHLPGEFRVTLDDGYSFKVTHLDNTLRVTHPLNTYNSRRHKDEIWIFGGSFTHGWSLNDEETYPWLLQKNLPEYEIVNFGVSGYGTLHSFIQFQEALERRRKPKIVIVAYASFHDQRNTFLRRRRKAVVTLNKLGPLIQPYARISKEGNLTYDIAKTEYQEAPFIRYSALAHVVEIAYNKYIEDQFYGSHKVTETIMKGFSQVAEENGVEFIVVGMIPDSVTSDMLEYCTGVGIMTADISVDPSIQGNRNLPHDGHPSAIANIQYAQKLESFLRRTVLK